MRRKPGTDRTLSKMPRQCLLCKPGLAPSFRRSLPETGCLSQGLPQRISSLLVPKPLRTPACPPERSSYVSAVSQFPDRCHPARGGRPIQINEMTLRPSGREYVWQAYGPLNGSRPSDVPTNSSCISPTLVLPPMPIVVPVSSGSGLGIVSVPGGNPMKLM